MISTSDKEWRLDLGDIKEQLSQWTYVTFTWEFNRGLKVYLQGNLTASTSKPQNVSRGNVDRYTELIIRAPSSPAGYFHYPTQIYDLSIWRKEIAAYFVAYRFKNSK